MCLRDVRPPLDRIMCVQTCNGCNHTSAVGMAMFRVSFAAYLMGAERGSYFGAGTHFHSNADWDYSWPDLNQRIGAPKGPAVRVGNAFTRQFERLTAHVDCDTQTGRLQWMKEDWN